MSLQDAKLTQKDKCLTYIDFKNSFGSIDHRRLLAIMKDIGYPQDAIKFVGNIYAKTSTSFRGTHFTTTPPIQIARGTINGSPYLFIIFPEPLLQWL